MSYACTNCGSRDTSVFRDSKVNPLLLCCGCGFKFHMEDSIEAEKADALPDPSSVQSRRDSVGEDVRDQDIPRSDPDVRKPDSNQVIQRKVDPVSIPRTPSYVIISKDRKITEFATKKDVKKKILKWIAAEQKFDCYELQPKKIEANIDI